MFHFLRGTVKHCADQLVVLEVAGVGFELSVPNAGVFQVQKEAQIATYLHWNQEQGPSLFGFASPLEKDIFTMIISCSGMGPKIGLAALGQMSPADFLDVIQRGDQKMLSSINGIGPKKAEHMIVQLRHKVEKILESGKVIESGSPQLQHIKEVSDVLHSLDYSRQEINQALQYTRKAAQDASLSFDQLLRHALSYLSQRN